MTVSSGSVSQTDSYADEVYAFPMSFAQQRLWFLDRWNPGSASYNVPIAYRLSGRLDVDVLWRAFDAVVERHETLRTTFRVIDDEPRQVVAPHRPLLLQVEDLTALADNEREAEAQRRWRKECEQPFDLENGPIFRLRLLKLAADDHLLLFTIHHVAFDGASGGVLVRELGALYRAFVAGSPNPLPPLAIQCADFAVWQRARFDDGEMDADLAYWRTRLASVEPLEMPTDRPRQRVLSDRGGRSRFCVPEDSAARLRSLAREERASLFMVLLAGLQGFLARYAGQEDITVGTPVEGRTRAELEGLIGFFANTLALRTDLSGDPTFRELVRRARQTCLEAYEHQELPFEQLVQDLSPARDAARTPLFQVLFVHQAASGEPWMLGDGIEAAPVPGATDTAKFDLLVDLSDTPLGLVGTLEFSADLFDAATAERMAGHLSTMLAAAAADPDSHLLTLPLISDTERQALTQFGVTPTVIPDDLDFVALVEGQAAATPNRPALVFEGRELTYQDLDARANQLAHRLQSLGVGPDVVVAIAVERSLEMIVAVLGVLKAGGAYAPIDPAYPSDRIAFMLEDAKSPVLLTLGRLANRFAAHPGRRNIRLDDDWDSEIAPLSADRPARAARPDHLAYVIYTSGSTGHPKGVAMVRRALTNLILWQRHEWPVSGGGNVLQFASLSFDVSFQEIFSALSTGARLVLISEDVRRDPAALVRVAERNHVDTVFLPPVMLHEFVRAARTPDASGTLPALHLRQIITAGEQFNVDRNLAEWLASQPQCRVHNHYGPTEAHVVTSFTLPESFTGPAPIGQPIANARIYILDTRGEPVPPNVAGELWIGGVCVARGYLDRVELTMEKFVGDPFVDSSGARMYRTGDRARWRSDGIIEFLGRLDRQVKVRGFRIEPGEIETLLARHADVERAVVTAHGEDAGRRLIAYVVPRANRQISIEGLQAFAKEALPGYMVPSVFVPISTIPLTPNGKVDLRSLPQPAGESAVDTDHAGKPRTLTEQMLVMIWERLLGCSVKRTDDFFDVGGHSMLAVRLVTEIKETFGVDVPLVAFYSARTIEQLAVRVLDRTQEQFQTLIPIQRNGNGPALFCVSPPNANALGYVFLSRRLGTEQPVYGLQIHTRDGSVVPYSQKEQAENAAKYIAAMRKVQPTGPYFLIGYCEGAHIAFEMARQLDQAGDEVGMLTILDAWPQENTRRFHLFLLHYYMQEVHHLIHAKDRMEFVTKKIEGVLRRLFQHVRSGFTTGSSDGPASLLFARYWPGPEHEIPTYRGRIVLFKVKDQPYWRIRDPLMGWGARALGGVELIPLLGKHTSVLREPAVAIVADLIRARIAAKAEDETGTSDQSEFSTATSGPSQFRVIAGYNAEPSIAPAPDTSEHVVVAQVADDRRVQVSTKPTTADRLPEPTPSILSEVSRHSVIYTIGNLLTRSVGFFLLPFYTRFLTPREYGVAELTELTTSVTSLLLGASAAGDALIRVYYEFSEGRDRNAVVSTSLWVACGLAAAAFALGALAAPLLAADILGDPQLSGFVRLSFLALVAAVPLELCLVFVRMQQRSKVFVLFATCYTACQTIGNIAFIAYFHLGIWGLVYSKLICATAAIAVLGWDVLRTVGSRWSGQAFARLRRFGTPLVATSVAFFVIHFSDRWFIASYARTEDVGIYAVGYKFGFLITFLIGEPFGRIWDARVFAYSGRPSWRREFSGVFSLFFLALTAMWVLLSTASQPLISIGAGAAFRGAAGIVPWVAFGYVLRSCGDFFRQLLYIDKRTALVRNIVITAAAVNLILNWILIPRFGITGAAVATALTWGVYALMCYVSSQRLYNVPYRYGILGSVSGLSIPIVVLVHAALPLFAVLSLTLIGLGCAVVLVRLTSLGRLNWTPPAVESQTRGS